MDDCLSSKTWHVPRCILKLRCDNQGSTKLAYNPIIHAHMMHVELDYHYV
jgi:hypothetical protein